MACNGLKKGSFNFLRHPKWCGIIFGKHIFDPFLTHFLSHNNPFSRHFGILGGPRRATTSSKCAKNTCFWHPMWSRIIFEKRLFFCTRWTLLTPLGTHLFGLPLVACRSPLGLGTGV